MFTLKTFEIKIPPSEPPFFVRLNLQVNDSPKIHSHTLYHPKKNYHKKRATGVVNVFWD